MAASDSYVPGICVDTGAATTRRRKLSRSSFVRIYSAGTLLADCVTSSLAILSLEVFSAPQIANGNGSMRLQAALAVLTGGLTALLLSKDAPEDVPNPSPAIHQTEQVLRASVTSLLFLYLMNLTLGLHLLNGRSLIGLAVIPLSLALQRHAATYLRQKLHEHGYGIDRIVICFAGNKRTDLDENYESILRSKGFHVVGRIQDEGGPPAAARGEDDRRALERAEKAVIRSARLRAIDCDLLGIAGQCINETKLAGLIAVSEEIGLPVALIRGRESSFESAFYCDGDLIRTTFSNERVERFAWPHRLVDVLVSLCLLAVVFPLFLAIAIAVRLDSEGPAFFLQERVGKNGRHFQILKFRSMLVNSPHYEVSPVQACDPRITRVGRILRRLSMDELPQLINVIRGDMALVGPRPEMPFLVQRHAALHRIRLKVKPGITGLWQLSADRARPIHENIHHDLYYIRNRNFFLDLAILIHTWFRATYGGV